MLSNKPYLIRAFYDWIVDSGCTPYVMINAAYPRCQVPQEFVENNEITLNISPHAIRDLKIARDTVEFRASFSGVVHIISAPIKSILAIYAQENQQGMFFDYEEDDSSEGDGTVVSPASSKEQQPTEEVSKEKKRPAHLRLVE